MKNNRDRVLLLLFAAGVLLCTLTAICFPAPNRSERENRELAAPPRFSVSSLFDGSFTAETDLYLTERFLWRQPLREVRAVSELMLGKLEVSGILLGSDRSLVARPTYHARTLATGTGKLKRLETASSDAGLPCYIAPVPWKAEMRGEVLPRFFDANDPERVAFSGQFERVIDLSSITGAEQWFRTDHHWTVRGAYAAYTSICPALGITPIEEEKLQYTPISDAFWGTSDAAAGLPGIPADSLELARYEGDEAFLIARDGAPAVLTGFYDMEKLDMRDKYSVFLGGNCGVLTVKTPGDGVRKTLLLVKDSFANPVIPLLARDFDIIAVDPRYTKEDPAVFLPEADAVLVLMGMQTLGG